MADLRARGVALKARWALGLVLVAALIVRLTAAHLAVNEIWPDEIIQTLEQAHRLAFGYGIVPWEFRNASRSWLLPGTLAAAMKLGAGLGGHLTWTVGFLCALSVFPIAVVYENVRNRAGSFAALLAGLLLASWFELVYFAPKALNEVVAGHLLLSAVFLDATRRPRLLGWLLGLSSALRLPLAPVALGIGLVAARSLNVQQRRQFALAFAAPISCAGLLDALTWSYPFESFVNNFRVNVLQGKSARYGVAPAWGYLVAQLRVLGWAAIPLYAAAVLGARRVPRAGSAALAILFVHSCLGHKEYRFIFPASAIVIALAAVGVSELASRSRPLAVGALLLLGSAGVVRGIDFHTEQTTLGLWLYPASGQWSNDRGPLLAFELFSHDPRVCGVGLLGVPWYVTGGYTWLHRAIPIVELRTADEQDPNPSSVNALVGPEHLPARFGSFERRACWTGVCAYARAGGCTPTAGYSLNDVIMARGE